MVFWEKKMVDHGHQQVVSELLVGKPAHLSIVFYLTKTQRIKYLGMHFDIVRQSQTTSNRGT